MSAPPPRPALTERDLVLLQLIAAEAPLTTIADRAGIPADQVADAIDAVLAVTGTRTRAHAAAWATAQRIVTATSEPCAAQTAAPALPPRLLQVLRGWAGGHTSDELTDLFGVAPATMRSYSKTILGELGVRSQTQAAIAGVLCDLVRLTHVDPAWPAVPLGAASSPTARRAA